MKKILIIGLILAILLTGCAGSKKLAEKDSSEAVDSTPAGLKAPAEDTMEGEGFTKSEVESLASFVIGGEEDVEILNTYREGNVWKVHVKKSGKTDVVEVNAKTGDIECIVYSDGFRECFN